MALSGTPVNFGTPNDLTTAAITGTLPSSTVGDVAYCWIVTSNGGSTPPTMSSAPTGWSVAGTVTDAATNAVTVWLYYRVIAASEPTSVTWTLSSGSNTNAVMWCESGRNTSTPYKNLVVDVHAGTGAAKTTATITATGGTIFSGFADRSGGVYSAGTDTLLTNGNPQHSAASSLYVQWSVSDVAAGSVTRTITGPSTSVGAQFIYESVAVTPAGAAAGFGSAVAAANTAHPIASPLAEFVLSTGNMYVGHRGISAENAVTWGVECSAKAYQSCVDLKLKAVEIPVWMTTDGVWVISHDRDTARIFTTSVDIPTNPYSALTGLSTATAYPGTNYPIAKLVDVLAILPASMVVFVDNKQSLNITAFLDLLDSYSNATGRFVLKGSYDTGTGVTSTSVPMSGRLRGYWSWGFYYETDLASLPTTAQYFDLLGMDYAASAGAWTTILGYGKPVLGHVTLSNTAQNTAFSKGANGVVTGKAFNGIPNAPTDTPSGATSAFDAVPTVSPNTDTPTAVVSVFDPTISTSSPGNAIADTPSGAVSAFDAVPATSPNADTPTASVSAFDPTVTTTTPGSAASGYGASSGTAYDASVAVGASALLTLAVAVSAFDATVSVGTGATTAFIVQGSDYGPYVVGS